MENPKIRITMENGDIMEAELYKDVAPITVDNFISLVKKHFYTFLGLSGIMRLKIYH